MTYWREVVCEVCSLTFDVPFWVLWFKRPDEVCMSQYCRGGRR